MEADDQEEEGAASRGSSTRTVVTAPATRQVAVSAAVRRPCLAARRHTMRHGPLSKGRCRSFGSTPFKAPQAPHAKKLAPGSRNAVLHAQQRVDDLVGAGAQRALQGRRIELPHAHDGAGRRMSVRERADGDGEAWAAPTQGTASPKERAGGRARTQSARHNHSCPHARVEGASSGRGAATRALMAQAARGASARKLTTMAMREPRPYKAQHAPRSEHVAAHALRAHAARTGTATHT